MDLIEDIELPHAGGIHMPLSTTTNHEAPHVVICLCVPDDQKRHLPKRHRAQWPHGAPIPRLGEVIYLSSSSAWGVSMVIHEPRGDRLRTEVWLEHVSGSRHTRPTGFALTQ